MLATSVGGLLLFPFLLRANGEPEKIVEGAYAVVLSLVPEGEATKLRFFFRDIRSGALVQAPVVFLLRLEDEEKNLLAESGEVTTRSGVGEFSFQFPRKGIYGVSMKFHRGDQPGKVYFPDDWHLVIQDNEPAPSAAGQIAAAAVLLLGVLALVWWRLR